LKKIDSLNRADEEACRFPGTQPNSLPMMNEAPGRRQFLRMLATSPALAAGGWAALLNGIAKGEDLITAADQAVNVLEFEDVARQNLPPWHYGYLATGVTDDSTLKANRDAFARYQLRTRRLVDVKKVDMSVTLYGTTWDSPIMLSPVGSQRAFHPEGEIPVARAAAAQKHNLIVSTHSSTPIEAVNEALGHPAWFQLYPTDDWNVTKAVVKRAEKADCPVMVLTVDSQNGALRDTLFKLRRAAPVKCTDCHIGGFVYNAVASRRPMFEGLDLSKVTTQLPLDMTWDVLPRLKELTTMKLVIKGIVTREDALLALEHGADGIIVSNHGGRSEDSKRASIDCLPEVIAAVNGKVPVLVDGGFRRGTDFFKALAMGARAVCVGRPYLWGLAAFGQAGVETVLTLLRKELQIDMRQAGTASISQITRDFLIEG
jgi:isopentenyl diphosphate isomerase/L-lactate dehydrogenase-like FMN-dependent dehydrogenase